MRSNIDLQEWAILLLRWVRWSLHWQRLVETRLFSDLDLYLTKYYVSIGYHTRNISKTFIVFNKKDNYSLFSGTCLKKDSTMGFRHIIYPVNISRSLLTLVPCIVLHHVCLLTLNIISIQSRARETSEEVIDYFTNMFFITDNLPDKFSEWIESEGLADPFRPDPYQLEISSGFRR